MLDVTAWNTSFIVINMVRTTLQQCRALPTRQLHPSNIQVSDGKQFYTEDTAHTEYILQNIFCLFFFSLSCNSDIIIRLNNHFVFTSSGEENQTFLNHCKILDTLRAIWRTAARPGLGKKKHKKKTQQENNFTY